MTLTLGKHPEAGLEQVLEEVDLLWVVTLPLFCFSPTLLVSVAFF